MEQITPTNTEGIEALKERAGSEHLDACFEDDTDSISDLDHLLYDRFQDQLKDGEYNGGETMNIEMDGNEFIISGFIYYAFENPSPTEEEKRYHPLLEKEVIKKLNGKASFKVKGYAYDNVPDKDDEIWPIFVIHEVVEFEPEFPDRIEK